MKDILLWLLALILLGWSLYYIFRNKLSRSDVLVWLLTGVVLIYAAFWRRLDPWLVHTVPGRILLGVLAAGAAAFLVLLCVILWGQKTNTANGQENVIMILGCAVIGRRPSRALLCRLEAALAFYRKHPKAMLITCGGQGPREDISEAQAMKDWLTAHEVPAEQILTEGSSSSTEENFRFAAERLREIGWDPAAPAAFVTNGFHCYRAGKYAAKEGFVQARAVPAGLPAGPILSSYLREALAVAHYWMIKSRR